MNFLAHLFLSPDPPTMVGNMVADFTRSPQDYPSKIRRGIHLHWAIDEFTDSHRLVAQSRKLFSEDHGKYSWVLVDIGYDHILARHWNRHSPTSLVDFTREVQMVLDDHRSLLPSPLLKMVDGLAEHNWLAAYQDRSSMDRVFARLARRASFSRNLDRAGDTLDRHYHELEQHFLAFFPDLVSHVDEWWKEQAS